jgi:hypothetical protein
MADAINDNIGAIDPEYGAPVALANPKLPGRLALHGNDAGVALCRRGRDGVEALLQLFPFALWHGQKGLDRRSRDEQRHAGTFANSEFECKLKYKTAPA